VHWSAIPGEVPLSGACGGIQLLGLGYVGEGGNEIYNNEVGVSLSGTVRRQHVHHNVTGIGGSGTVGGNSFDDANLIEENTTGVQTEGEVRFNRISRNQIGVTAGSGQYVHHNLICRNQTQGLQVDGEDQVSIFHNTFYAPEGNNVFVTGGASGVEVVSNILWSEAAYDVRVSDDSQSGFFSDYNDLHASGPGNTNLTPTVGFSGVSDVQMQLTSYNNRGDLQSAPTITFPLQPGFGEFGAYEFLSNSNDVTPPTKVGSTPAAVDASGNHAALVWEITLLLSEPIDTIDTLATANFEVRSDGENNLFDDAGDVVYTLTPVYVADSTSLTLQISDGPLLAGRYLITAFGHIHDLAGLQLDGDADRNEGGNYLRIFTISVLGDFDGDTDLDLADVDALTQEIVAGPHNLTFDVTGDNLVDENDLDTWVVNLKGALHGDVKLDYSVDSVDFNIWLSNAFTFDTAWSQGNVNGYLAIDVRDFNVWNKYKFTPIVAPITSANGQGAMSAPLRRPRSAFAAANMENETSSVIAFAEEIASHPLSQWLEPLENHRSDQLFNEQYVTELPGQLALEAPLASAVWSSAS